MNAVVGIGNQQHVALVDRRPAADAGAVHAEAFFERRLAQLVDGIGNVVLQSRQVGEAEIEQLGFVLLRELQDGFGSAMKVFSLCPRTGLKGLVELDKGPILLESLHL